MFPPKIIDAGILLNSLIVHQALLLHAKVGVWCLVNAKLTVGPIFYVEIIYWYVCETNNRIPRTVHRVVTTYVWFQQDLATAHTTGDSLATMEGVTGDRIMS
jgi:carbonic anhydrase/acetyltransferase-like protein (isoleucine patch superfamily)